jgi:hypothetical protein
MIRASVERLLDGRWRRQYRRRVDRVKAYLTHSFVGQQTHTGSKGEACSRSVTFPRLVY